MITIQSEILINAPRQFCFDLARDMDVHVICAARTKEKVVAGRIHGKLILGDTVTFEAIHFGIRQRLTSKIILLDSPNRFIDQVLQSAFHFLRHTHTFTEAADGTVMHDRLDIAAPFGPIGWVAERLFLGQYMHQFLLNHQAEFKRIAEEYQPDPLALKSPIGRM